MLKTRLRNWPAALAPLALCVFVAGLGAMPYVLSRRDGGSLGVFVSAYDEGTYLIDSAFVPYRLLSDLLVGAMEQVTAKSEGLLLLSDVLLPIVVVLAAWALVTRCLKSTGPRLLAVLLLLFGQEIFSLANSIVWPSGPILELRNSDLPLSLEVIPDSTSSFFSLFRTPEPEVSSVILFGFLALIAEPDPLRAFEGPRRWLTFAIFAVLPFSYPFIAVPILMLTGVLLAFAIITQRSRTVGVIVALAITVAAWLAVRLAAGAGDEDATSSLFFDSRLPMVSPAILAGLAIAALMLFVHRGEVLRRAELLLAFTAALLPAVLANQQIVTGFMISAGNWERNINYAPVLFALLVLVGRKERSAGRLPLLAEAVGWVGAGLLGIMLIGWQHQVYEAWRPLNLVSRQAADLLEGMPSELASKPVVVEDAGMVPVLRLLTDDSYDFVLDYTRLFYDSIPPFTEGWKTSEAQAASQERIFEYWFRLGRTPAQVEAQLNEELRDINLPGFYSHFLFAFRDVWPALTDWRLLDRAEALRLVPAKADEYARFVRERQRSPTPPVVLITNGRPGDLGDNRRLELLASAPPSALGPGPRMYLERSGPSSDPDDRRRARSAG
ncbi:MAG: hypothetical protein H0V25_04065 [Solirubrobacterales bacterium]|nr:hypothetical protein [Solirubrobacterales bacterium]